MSTLMIDWLKARAREPSTYAGLVVVLATALHLSVDSSTAQMVAEALAGLAGVFMAAKQG